MAKRKEKTLLSEQTIRRWGKLAHMPALTTNFLSEQKDLEEQEDLEETKEELEEDQEELEETKEELGEDQEELEETELVPKTPGKVDGSHPDHKLSAASTSKPKESLEERMSPDHYAANAHHNDKYSKGELREMPMPPEEEEMPAPPPMEDPMGGEEEMGGMQDSSPENIVRALLQAMAAVAQEEFGVNLDIEDEGEMGAEEPPMAPPLDMGGEEEEVPVDEDTLDSFLAEFDVVNKEELVNEVVKRVAKRLIARKANKQVDKS